MQKLLQLNHRNLSSVKVSFIRHGQTEMNLKSVVQGHADSSLTNLGFEQAANFGKANIDNKLKFTKAFCSDLGRTRQTINSILTNDKINSKLLDSVIYTSKLRERYYGEGVDGVWSIEKYLQEAADAGVEPRQYEPPGKGIETLSQLENRGLNFLETEIVNLNDKDHVLVVTHAIFLREMFWLLDNKFGIEGTEHLQRVIKHLFLNKIIIIQTFCPKINAVFPLVQFVSF